MTRQEQLRFGRPVWIPRSAGRKHRYIPLSGNHTTSVAIVGGGMTGALAAHAFASAGIATTLLEAGVAGRGSTAASAALLLQEPDLELARLADRYGTRTSRPHMADEPRLRTRTRDAVAATEDCM
jgi:choline dehydrogenase-like flavoprotein